jgi:spore coat polysaccharide biosynthesis protein SpsF (cytidylyltransferase family)
MKVIAISQARTGSTRLPNKVLLEVSGKTLLQIHIERVKNANQVDKIIIATTNQPYDDKIEYLANQYKVSCYRGSEYDVLDRFYQAVKNEKPDYVVRLTSDCPLIDSSLLDEIIIEAKKRNLDYYTNCLEEHFPDGQDIEIFKFSALEKAWKSAKLNSEREHVTPYIRNNSSYNGGVLFRSDNHSIEDNYNHVRLTVDEPEDFEVIKLIVEKLGFDKNWKTYTNYYLENDFIKSKNKNITRNEGYQKSITKD